MSNILTIENLEKTYKSKDSSLTIFKDLNLSVEEGSKTVITGESGSGKSTLLNIISSIDTATRGSVLAGSREVTKLKEREASKYRSEYLGLIFQFHYLLKDFTALENVYLPALIKGMNKKEAMEKAMGLLSDVGLSERKDHLPSELSGGECQRVSVARSLINDPQLILADEPTGNLDPENAEKIAGILFDMVDKYRKTLILVTHDMHIAEKGGRIYRINKGKLESVK